MNKGNYGLAKHRTYHPEELASPSKYLFSYRQSKNGFDYVVESGGDYTKNLFDLLYSNNNAFISDITGTYKFDNFNDMFQRGKAFKIKGRLVFKLGTTTATIFNMRFGFDFNDPGKERILVYQNANSSNHTANGKTTDYTPVDFEIILMNATSPYYGKTYCQASGFYQYCNDIQSTESIANDAVRYIPLISNNIPDPIVEISSNQTQNPIRFKLAFNGTDSNITILRLHYLNIEVYER